MSAGDPERRAQVVREERGQPFESLATLLREPSGLPFALLVVVAGGSARKDPERHAAEHVPVRHGVVQSTERTRDDCPHCQHAEDDPASHAPAGDPDQKRLVADRACEPHADTDQSQGEGDVDAAQHECRDGRPQSEDQIAQDEQAQSRPDGGERPPGGGVAVTLRHWVRARSI